MRTATLPGLEVGTWEVRGRADPAAVALADRHYSRGRPGTSQIGPPGRVLVFVTPDEDAVWLSHWPLAGMAMDRLDAWRCSIFRNEGPSLSSDLIRAAMALTAALWAPAPDGWITWVETAKVRSTNPGYCFQQAGWVVDRAWAPARGRRGRIRLRAAI